MNTTAAGAEARAKIMERLRKLLAMTTENGATEAEALAAAKMAADLMAEHDLTYETVGEVKGERYGVRTRPLNGGLARKAPHEARWLATGIADLHGCRTWGTVASGVEMLAFFGAEADTEAAHLLYARIVLTMEAEHAAYRRSPHRRDRSRNAQRVRAAFMTQMGARISERLEDIRTAREVATRQVAAETGRALVLVAKEQEVAARYAAYVAERGMRLRTTTSRTAVRSGAAGAAGYAAGSRINLGDAAISGGIKMIGRA
ncbi:MAG TPA: DUF2786 domain-containing protein [Hyphomicrobiaceae bacterium]|jgi:hypothetical protein